MCIALELLVCRTLYECQTGKIKTLTAFHDVFLFKIRTSYNEDSASIQADSYIEGQYKPPIPCHDWHLPNQLLEQCQKTELD